MKIVSFVGRTALTIWLLVLVYQGSQLALVIILAMICLGLELTGWLLQWTRERQENVTAKDVAHLLRR